MNVKQTGAVGRSERCIDVDLGGVYGFNYPRFRRRFAFFGTLVQLFSHASKREYPALIPVLGRMDRRGFEAYYRSGSSLAK